LRQAKRAGRASLTAREAIGLAKSRQSADQSQDFTWVRLPAWGALGLWLGMECLGLYQQRLGLTNVAATAHLGGAAVGFLVWLSWRRLEKHQAEPALPSGMNIHRWNSRATIQRAVILG